MTSDQRVNEYRAEYDQATADFNQFLETYSAYLPAIDEKGNAQKRPLFQMASED